MADRSSINSSIDDLLKNSGPLEVKSKGMIDSFEDLGRSDVTPSDVNNTLEESSDKFNYRSPVDDFNDSSAGKSVDTAIDAANNAVSTINKTLGIVGLEKAKIDYDVMKAMNVASFNGFRPSLREFYNAFSVYNRLDKRYSLLKNYMFDVSITFSPTVFTDYTPNFKSDFYTLYLYFILSGVYKLLISDIEVPNINVNNVDAIETEFGVISLPSGKLLPDSNRITMSMLNTEDNLAEGFLFIWLGYVTSDVYWSTKFPFPKATITVDFMDDTRTHKAYSYTFKNCYPMRIETNNASHSPDGLKQSRQVEFVFESMKVDYNSAFLKARRGNPLGFI